MMTPVDQILKKYRDRNDKDSLDSFCLELSEEAIRYIGRLSNNILNSADIEDLAQSAIFSLLKVCGDLSRRKDLEYLGGLFYTLCKRELIDEVRRQGRRKVSYVSSEKLDSEATASDKANAQRVLPDFLKKILTVHEQRLLFMRYVSGMTYKEISRLTGKSNDSLRQDNSRAIQKIRIYFSSSPLDASKEHLSARNFPSRKSEKSNE